MPAELLHQLVWHSAELRPDAVAIRHKTTSLSYAALADSVAGVAGGLQVCGIKAGDRVAVYLPKCPEAVTSFFACSQAAAVFVPVNPLLKPRQLAYILRDCGVRVLVTSVDRLHRLQDVLADCDSLELLVLVDAPESVADISLAGVQIVAWADFSSTMFSSTPLRSSEALAAILYTSGSTGQPKGVMLSHRNLCVGAASVAEYLENTAEDRLLAVLPFSFDYGLSQLTTAFLKGASVVLMDYLLPRDVLTMVARERITGLAAVPPLWNQLAQLEWSASAAGSLRYLTNSGGALTPATLSRLRRALPRTRCYLMYGLTEAFRSTYLSPELIDEHPGSIGKAIPNARVMVVNERGQACKEGEEGELVHAGPLVAKGYWNAPAETAQRFRPLPQALAGKDEAGLAVWSGDTVRVGAEGYLYFVGRKDEMIKTSGYRISPAEIEAVAQACDQVAEAVALGVPHPLLGQGIVLLVVSRPGVELDKAIILRWCQKELPAYMQPLLLELRTGFPCGHNGKIDRRSLMLEYQDVFCASSSVE